MGGNRPAFPFAHRAIVRKHVACKGIHLGRLPKIARKRDSEPASNRLVSAHVRHALAKYRLEIIAHDNLRVVRRLKLLLWPTSAHGHLYDP